MNVTKSTKCTIMSFLFNRITSCTVLLISWLPDSTWTKEKIGGNNEWLLSDITEIANIMTSSLL